MLKRQRLQREVDNLVDAVDIARAMLKDGHVETARQFLLSTVGAAYESIVLSAKDPDDYPPEHRARFDAIVAEVQRLAPDCKHDIGESRLTVAGRRDGATWLARVAMSEDGLDEDCMSPELGSLSHSGGRVPPDQPPEETARSLLKAAGVQVPKA